MLQHRFTGSPSNTAFCCRYAYQAKEKAEAEERKARGLAAKGHCDSCGKGLIEKKAFRRFEFTYCTTDCANAHKRKLAADAAERRFNQG